MPSGLKDVFESGVEAGQTILGVPKTAKTFMIVGITIFGVILLVVVGTMAWGVGSGKIDVNELAESASRTAVEASKNAPAVIPI